MREKVEFDVEKLAVERRHRRSPQTPRRHVERNIPPMVLQRRESQACLTYDLHVHMQRCGSVFPLLPFKIRPCFEMRQWMRQESTSSANRGTRTLGAEGFRFSPGRGICIARSPGTSTMRRTALDVKVSGSVCSSASSARYSS